MPGAAQVKASLLAAARHIAPDGGLPGQGRLCPWRAPATAPTSPRRFPTRCPPRLILA